MLVNPDLAIDHKHIRLPVVSPPAVGVLPEQFAVRSTEGVQGTREAVPTPLRFPSGLCQQNHTILVYKHALIAVADEITGYQVFLGLGTGNPPVLPACAQVQAHDCTLIHQKHLLLAGDQFQTPKRCGTIGLCLKPGVCSLIPEFLP